jgi:hypothetical protein
VSRQTPKGGRALEISSHNQLEIERLNRLAGYRFIAKTDISRFYHSIYTHSIAWAFHGKDIAKKDRKFDSSKVYFNRLDFILRQRQDSQTFGVPVGPDASELICTSINTDFHSRYGDGDIGFIRHVDDVWIGAQSHSEVERALWLYPSAKHRHAHSRCPGHRKDSVDLCVHSQTIFAPRGKSPLVIKSIDDRYCRSARHDAVAA